MSRRKWDLREYKPDDLKGFQELFTEVFHEPRSPDYFIWKFNDNPAGRGIVAVAEDSGHIVGHCALMPTLLRIGGESVLGAQNVDAMTHSDYRNQGMFLALQKACMQQAIDKKIEVLYAVPGRHASGSYNGCVRSLNWDHTGDIPQWVRVLNPRSLTSSFSRSVRLMSWGLQLMPMGKISPSGIDIRMERPKESDFLSLGREIASTEPKGTCRIERSAEWFRWRFDSVSQREYVWFSAYRDGHLKAWAVFGRNDWGEIPLIDMAGGDAETLKAVTFNATRRAKELGLAMLLSCTTVDSVAHALKSCGYVRHGNMPLIVRSLTSRILEGNIHLHSSWRITSQDFDTF